MKKVLLAASIASALSLFNFAHANSGTIDFDGEVVDATCDVVVNDGSATVTTVTLPAVSKGLLAGANSVAGKTAFRLMLSNCKDFSGLTGKSVAAYYKPDATNVDSATGLLNNTATTGAATNVQLQLLDGTNNSEIMVGFANQMTSAGFVSIAGTEPTTAVLPYFVQYKSVAGGATAGDVKGTVAFDLMYK